MYKKIILSIFIFMFLTGCTIVAPDNASQNQLTATDNVRAVWLTYYELSEFTENNDEQQFKKAITKVLKELRSSGFNRLTVQVRPFADAFYRSAYFPTSAYCFGAQGGELLYDPLQIIIDCASKQGISIEAWVNPYRISNKTDFSDLSGDNIALEYKSSKPDNLIICDSGIYFNPASDDVKALVVNGVREIVENYAVSSVCFDDYFYPTADSDIDENSYNSYLQNGGTATLDNWRRENVSDLISLVYRAIKEVNEGVTFGISPSSNIKNNYSTLYADVELWATESGYVDYLCPQIYFGFQNENQPFMSTTKEWAQMTDCTLYVALPLYKAGLEDEFAGDSGKNEFIENNNILARQVTYLSKLDEISGFYIFSYSSLKDNDETVNLYSAIHKSSE